VAENYHQDYYNRNGNQPYCYFVIRPKLEKFEKAFKDKMKKNEQLQTAELQVSKEDFLEYIAIQESGMFNMFDPRARQMTSISKTDWIYIMKNYSDLKAYYEV
jgi:hypothetical protein